ncbi:MAG: hypothetical protein LBS34_01460 [Rickettsiales bacterium]|nr:hypothetical protein [Rickettsiales bacterium]
MSIKLYFIKYKRVLTKNYSIIKYYGIIKQFYKKYESLQKKIVNYIIEKNFYKKCIKKRIGL